MKSIEKGSLPLSRQQTQESQNKRIREAAKMYEKQFLSKMVKAMRSTVSHSKMTQPSMAQKMFTEKLDQKYVEAWSERGGVGLADIIHEQLQAKLSGRKQMSKPSGPLPIGEGNVKPHGIESEQEAMELMKALPDSGWLFKNPTDQKVEVQAPWEGQVDQVWFEEGHQHLRVKHPENVTSLLRFEGELDGMESGQTLSPGERLGWLKSHGGNLAWKVGVGPA